MVRQTRRCMHATYPHAVRACVESLVMHEWDYIGFPAPPAYADGPTLMPLLAMHLVNGCTQHPHITSSGMVACIYSLHQACMALPVLGLHSRPPLDCLCNSAHGCNYITMMAGHSHYY